MKATLIAAAAAALLGSANAHRHGHHHRDLFRRNYTEICQTFVTTITGSPIWVPTPACSNCPVTTPVVPVANTTVVVPTPKTTPPTTPAVPATTSSKSTTPATTPATTTSKTVPATTPHPYTVPTAVVEVCPTPDTYTFPATTVVVTETTTVCGASPTKVPSGTHTLGGVTTVVTTATTVTCPVATTSTASGGVVTSVIQTTTYVCPSAGTYTINPITTTCTEETLVVVPVVTSFTPGTYTKPAVVTTVTETSVVVVCPFDIPTPTPAPAPAPATTTVAKVETPKVETPKVETTTQAVKVETPKVETPVKVETTTQAVQTPKVETPKVETPVKVETTTQAVETPKTTPKVLSATTVATTSPKASATTPAKSKSGGGLGSSNDHWAITYTPYGNGGACKGKSEVLSDLQGIKEKGFTTIRVYSTDCDTLPNVGAGCAATGLKMIIGVYVGEVGCDNGNPDVASQLASIKEWGQWDLVELVVVGNEAGHNGFCTPQELKSLIGNVKEIITPAGKSVPVTTTDTVATWQNTEFAEAICGVIDVVACNAHAYFNAETTPSQAGTFVKGQLDIVKEICGLEGYVLESGWPSECVANGVATCSQEDQEVAITSLKKELGGSIVFFSFGDDDWKDNGSCGCEQHWGCGQLF